MIWGKAAMDPHFLETIDELNKSGQRARVVPFLVNSIKAAPNDAEAWYLLSQYIPESERKLDCLERAIRLRPGYDEALTARDILAAQVVEPDSPAIGPVEPDHPAAEASTSEMKKPARLMELFKPVKTGIKTKRDTGSGANNGKIGAVLAGLGADYRVWHDVAGKQGSIAAVVLSRKGQLFMIETSALGGRVKVKGSTLYVNNSVPAADLIGQCLCDLYDLRELVQQATGIGAMVIGFLVFTQASVEPCKPLSNIRVITVKTLKRGIEELAANNGGKYELWSDAGALDEVFSRES
jgi:hypothetical protein